MVTNTYNATIIDIVQSSFWVLMVFFPSYLWPAMGISVSMTTLFLFRAGAPRTFRKPLLIFGVVLFQLPVFLSAVLYGESPLLVSFCGFAIGVLVGERAALLAFARKPILPPAKNAHHTSIEAPTGF